MVENADETSVFFGAITVHKNSSPSGRRSSEPRQVFWITLSGVYEEVSSDWVSEREEEGANDRTARFRLRDAYFEWREECLKPEIVEDFDENPNHHLRKKFDAPDHNLRKKLCENCGHHTGPTGLLIIGLVFTIPQIVIACIAAIGGTSSDDSELLAGLAVAVIALTNTVFCIIIPTVFMDTCVRASEKDLDFGSGVTVTSNMESGARIMFAGLGIQLALLVIELGIMVYVFVSQKQKAPEPSSEGGAGQVGFTTELGVSAE